MYSINRNFVKFLMLILYLKFPTHKIVFAVQNGFKNKNYIKLNYVY